MRIIFLFLSMSLVGCTTRQDLPTQNDVSGMIRYSSNKAIDHAVRSNEKVAEFLDGIRRDVSEIYGVDERTSIEGFSQQLRNDALSKYVFEQLNDTEKILVINIDSDINIYLRVDRYRRIISGVAK